MPDPRSSGAVGGRTGAPGPMPADGQLGIAVGQFAPGTSRDDNLAAMRVLTATAVSRGASLVVFPEYSAFFEGEMGPASVAAAEPLDGPFVQGLGRIAADYGIHVVAGMLERTTDQGRFSNTLVAVSPGGDRVAAYRKVHLYDAFGARESDWVVPGPIDQAATFKIGDVTVGMQTCYDIRFPEVTRQLVDAGADVVTVPSEWVRGPLKEHHWRTLMTARAIENTVYVAAADHPPPVGVGNSMVLDPMGVELATIGEITDVAVAWISGARIAEVRKVNPALSLRRFGIVPR